VLLITISGLNIRSIQTHLKIGFLCFKIVFSKMVYSLLYFILFFEFAHAISR